MAKESTEAALERFSLLEALQEAYPRFDDFLADVMDLLGFQTSPVQYDIGEFLETGPQYIMVQAQRGQAKTTIAAALCVYDLIHNPTHRILVVSAGGTQANEISTLIVRIILTMPELECLRPDKAEGDRTSVEAFDIHYSLKGLDKSPSVACTGITSNLQGKRADILLADDIESAKNSLTPKMRELLLAQTKDFISICTSGRIIYLGTPQSMDSVYNTLPARGFTVRIWPGRVPTQAQLKSYGEHLAPFVRKIADEHPEMMTGGGLLGDHGQPIDPSYITEALLQAKERDQGPTYFQLQHMLNTDLADAARFPLKVEQLVIIPRSDKFPLEVHRAYTDNYLRDISIHSVSYKVMSPQSVSDDIGELQGKIMYVDPAGGGSNGDETAYAVTGFLNGNIYLLSAGGVPGGYGVAQMERLADIAARNKVNTVIVEKNMGYGAFVEVWTPILQARHPCSIQDDYVTSQKELRIIETLEPVICRGSLIVCDNVFEEDRDTTVSYPANTRLHYSLFNQLSHITRDKGALVHDDRLDALEGAVRHWQAAIAIDQERAIQERSRREWEEWAKNPLGRPSYDAPNSRVGGVINLYLRRK